MEGKSNWDGLQRFCTRIVACEVAKLEDTSVLRGKGHDLYAVILGSAAQEALERAIIAIKLHVIGIRETPKHTHLDEWLEACGSS